jgi:WD40 repeat protein
VSVAAEPDYTLTVWDWLHERVVLRSKAFSQDVFRVEFSPTEDSRLVSSGMGHIKFWKIAGTFTGLKLQGALGKFGATEISDVPTFAFLPSGRILSGTENGNLLVWDGGFIKYEISRKNGQKCHDGTIEFCFVDEGEIITAGQDGYVRLWDVEVLDSHDSTAAENASITASFIREFDVVDEIQVGKEVKIKHALKFPDSPNDLLIIDCQGSLWRVNTKKKSSEKLSNFHSSSVVRSEFSPVNHLMSSIGSDGTLQVHDPLRRETLALRKHSSSATTLCYLPTRLDGFGCTVGVGFADGSVRIYEHGQKVIKSTIPLIRTHAMRPHAHSVISIVFSPDGNFLSTAGEDGQVFFFTIRPPNVTPATFSRDIPFTPVGFISLKMGVKELLWTLDAKTKTTSNRLMGRFLVLNTAGDIYQLQIQLLKDYEKDHHYEIPETDYQLTKWQIQKYVYPIKSKEKLSTEGADSKQSSPGNELSIPSKHESESAVGASQGEKVQAPNFVATQIQYLTEDHFLIAFEWSDGITEIRSCLLSDAGISRLLLRLKGKITSFRTSYSGKVFLVGCMDGTVYYRPYNFDADIRLSQTASHDMVLYNEEHFWRSHVHLSQVRGVCASFEDALVCSAGNDGIIFTFKSGVDDIARSSVGDATMWLGDESDDLQNKYTIQEAKQMVKIDEENALADDKKHRRRLEVNRLKETLEALMKGSEDLPAPFRLTQSSFHMDPHLAERLGTLTLCLVHLRYHAVNTSKI